MTEYIEPPYYKTYIDAGVFYIDIKSLTTFINGRPSYIILEVRSSIELIQWRILFFVETDAATLYSALIFLCS